jgi:5-methylcytosine-specific restriction endonuclease McrA
MCNSAAHNARPNRESLGKRLGPAKVASIWARTDSCCAYCGERLVRGPNAHLDHLTPKSEGGADVVENLVLACRSCNSARRNLSLAQWAVYARETRGMVIDVAAILFAARRAA